MSPEEIVRAWKDPLGQVGTSAAGHPAGEIELSWPHAGGTGSTVLACILNDPCTFEFDTFSCCWTALIMGCPILQ